jgi:hypothetical protein
VDAQVDDPQRGLIDTRVETRIEEDTQPAGGMWASGEHASNEICGTGLLLCPARPTRVVDLRFPESEWDGERTMPESFLDHLLTSRIFRKVSL